MYIKRISLTFYTYIIFFMVCRKKERKKLAFSFFLSLLLKFAYTQLKHITFQQLNSRIYLCCQWFDTTQAFMNLLFAVYLTVHSSSPWHQNRPVFQLEKAWLFFIPSFVSQITICKCIHKFTVNHLTLINQHNIMHAEKISDTFCVWTRLHSIIGWFKKFHIF